MIVKRNKKPKRDRSLSKIIDFESEEQKQLAEDKAKKAGMKLKKWIESLIALNV